MILKGKTYPSEEDTRLQEEGGRKTDGRCKSICIEEGC